MESITQREPEERFEGRNQTKQDGRAIEKKIGRIVIK